MDPLFVACLARLHFSLPLRVALRSAHCLAFPTAVRHVPLPFTTAALPVACAPGWLHHSAFTFHRAAYIHLTRTGSCVTWSWFGTTVWFAVTFAVQFTTTHHTHMPTPALTHALRQHLRYAPLFPLPAVHASFLRSPLTACTVLRSSASSPAHGACRTLLRHHGYTRCCAHRIYTSFCTRTRSTATTLCTASLPLSFTYTYLFIILDLVVIHFINDIVIVYCHT